MLCEYCSREMPPDSPYCPYCGAVNPAYDDYVRQKAEEQKQAAETAKEILNFVNNLNKQQERSNEIKQHRREIQRRQREEKALIEMESVEGLKVAVLSSFITAAITTAGFAAGRNIDSLSMYMLFYIGNLVGNMFLLVVLIGLLRNKIARYITYSIIVLLSCLTFNSCVSKYKPNNSHTTASYTTYKATEPVISSNDKSVSSKSVNSKPVDGMTFAQLKEQKWGANMLYTKCRDFDSLRPEKRYYEARWYNSNGDLIGYGILCCQDENDDTAILAGFRDYTE